MKVIAPFDAHIPDLVEVHLKEDPLDPEAGYVHKGRTYDVPQALGKSLVAQGWKAPGQKAAKKATAKSAPGALQEPPKTPDPSTFEPGPVDLPKKNP